MDLKEVLSERIQTIEEVLKCWLPKDLTYASLVGEAMAYSVNAGGKRIRPIIMLEMCSIFNKNTQKYKDEKQLLDAISPMLASMEMIHTYSLVHDDLPAMDNDTLRRGKPTTWSVYGDGMALLAGDALLNYAYEVAFNALDVAWPEMNVAVIKAIRILAQKAGIHGMIGGQVADVEAEKNHIKLDGDRLMYIHENKTGALIQAAFMIGGIMGGANDQQVQLLSQIGLDVGVAFQIQDDVLDVIGNEELLGKNIGSDVASGKETYVDIYGLEKAQEDVARISDHAIGLLEALKLDSEFIISLVKALIDRKY